MINISFINDNGTGFGETRSLRDDVTVVAFFNTALPGANPRDYIVRINGQTVTANQILRNGDNLSIIRNAGAAAPAPLPAPVRTDTIRFIDNSAGGFADNLQIPAGQTIEGFLESRNIDPDDHAIRVNGDIVQSDYVLRSNDAVTVTPKKIDGAADIRVSLVCNDGTGFADYVDVAEGTTLSNLVAAKINLGNPKNFVISYNGTPVTMAHQVLRNGDRISITPNKIQGA